MRVAELDSSRRDVQFVVGDEVLLDTEHTPLPSRSLLSPRWIGSCWILARTHTGSTYPQLGASSTSSTSKTCTKYLQRPDHLGSDLDAGPLCPPPPAAGPDGVPEHEVQELLKFKTRYGRPYVLMRWTGLDAGNTWERIENLTNSGPTVRIPLPHSSRRPIAPSLARRRNRRRPAPPSRRCRSRRQASWSRRRHAATWALCW